MAHKKQGLLVLVESIAAGGNDAAAAAELRTAFQAAQSGKENSCGKDVKDAALQCFKAVQQRLAAPPGDAAATQQLAALGRASLAAAEALSPASAAPQVQGWRYNLVRRLVSCKAFTDAQVEASALFQQLSKQQAAPRGKTGYGGAGAAADAANLMVGTVLTLVLCCVEGRLFSSEAVQGMLQAVESLPPWLSGVKPDEAAKHSETAYKYLYKAAVLLLEKQDWQQLAAVCSAMLAAADGEAAAQQRAVQAVGKLSAHMPEEPGAAMLAAVACRASSLGSVAAVDWLGLLSMAAQKLTSSAASAHLQQAAVSCCESGGQQPVLQAAALLLPALVLQLPASGQTDWVHHVNAAAKLVSSSIEQLESAQVLLPGAMERHLDLLAAAYTPLNALRRVLAARLAAEDNADSSSSSIDGVCQRLGSAAGVETVASALDLLAGIVGVGSRHASQACRAAVFVDQGHAAAVGLVTAARLRAACLLQHPASGLSTIALSSRQAASWLLGWDLQAYSSDRMEPPPAACAVEPQELSWLASALFNIGVDMHASQHYAAAAAAIQPSVAAAALGLRALAEADPPAKDALPRLQDFCRKCSALSDAQQRAGDAADALCSLGHSLALLLHLGFVEPASWQPLVQAFVRLQAEQLEKQQPTVAPAATSTAALPARRGRGAGTKKATAAAADASSSSSGNSSTAPTDAMLVSILQQHAEDLPEGSILSVLEQELQSWAALLERQGSLSITPAGGGAATHLSSMVKRLLQDVYPVMQQPVEHARVLLVLHSLPQAALDGQGEVQHLERAVEVLSKAPGVEARSLLTRARCLLAVTCAIQLARQALLEQQQERQRSHAAASTSAAGSKEQDAAALSQLADGGRAAASAWQRIERQAQQAVQDLAAAGCCTNAGSQATFEELAWLLDLHGDEQAALQLRKPLPDDSQASNLPACLFPTSSASAAELQQQAEAAAGTSTVAQRAALHRQAAEAFAAAGEMVPALYHASEGHRLLAARFHEDGNATAAAAPAGQAGSSHSSGLGWWQLAGSYLGSLLQLGQLFEAAGLADEALHALREGQRLAVAVGAGPVAAMFAARLADVHCKQGQLAAAEQAATSAEQQLSGAAGGPSVLLQYCQAAVQQVKAQVSIAAGSAVSKAAWMACQAAVGSCEELVAAMSAEQTSMLGGRFAALHAAALLTTAEAALKRQDAASALQHASSALGATDGSCTCSAQRYQRAAALLFLGSHEALQPAPSEQHLSVWGLGSSSSGSSSAGRQAEAAEAPKARSRRAPAKPSAGRSRSKAAAACDPGDAASSAAGSSLASQQQQQLWQALELSKGFMSLHRSAAALLAEACGKQGYLHLAAWLLHASLGATMRLQYQLVLHSRQQQLTQRQRRAGAAGQAGSDAAAQVHELERLAAVLDAGLDWHVVKQLAGSAGAAPDEAPAAPAGRGRKTAGAAQAQAAAATPCDPAAALTALEQQAQAQLLVWQESLPAGTAACSIGVLPGSGDASLVISRLAPAGSDLPPLLVSLPVLQLTASLSQHPIRALRLDDDEEKAASAAVASSVQSVLDEMQAVLEDSGRSMRELSTDTKEQQREWWRARLALEDRLAALVKHLDGSWLGPWRCLLMGKPVSATQQPGQAAAQRLAQLLEAAGQPASQQQASVMQHAAAVLAQHAACPAGAMSPAELRQAAHQLCHAVGLTCSQEEQQQLSVLLAQQPEEQQASASAADASAATGDDDAPEPAAPRAGRKGGKSVKFADDLEQQPQQQPQQQQQSESMHIEGSTSPAAAPASRSSRSRRPAAGGRGKKASAAAAAAAATTPAATGGDLAEAAGANEEASPIATLGSVDSSDLAEAEPPQTAAAQGALCRVFDSLSLAEPPTSTAAAPRLTGTARTGSPTRTTAGKHRSRLRMMQASTPGPGTARKARSAALGTAATAPRPARELPLTVAKTAPPAAARPSQDEQAAAAAAAAAGPVLLVLDGALQALPWESTPGLLHQRIYRMPSLACAAASAQRANTSVDLGSTFYALNPSGDLATTQATFQHWFQSMRGWEGLSGQAPTAAQLATALQRHQLFLYCGHGGGEQYISVAKLRSLERCSAALLMGCSSGRLRAQQHYEPAGAVLAYLLAGCPAAVANLWDVTDKDIDRFSQAVLTSWLSGNGCSSSSSGEGSSSSGESSSGGGSSADSISSGGSDGQARGADMSAAVAAGRAACKLPHLVGAAPVCYGVPSLVYSSSQRS